MGKTRKRRHKQKRKEEEEEEEEEKEKKEQGVSNSKQRAHNTTNTKRRNQHLAEKKMGKKDEKTYPSRPKNFSLLADTFVANMMDAIPPSIWQAPKIPNTWPRLLETNESDTK